ncbi:MAG: hypothetical protein COV48_13355 [Elusimicrobia bacterium CG11_big_fil_rev_8_21_14_0_20_64_6]|nr:MAG: hypothetical protein COV48_13355 [Elusimicrobia bacterium CG11_big_fil_rev_8_21_14_0_20_64_6]
MKRSLALILIITCALPVHAEKVRAARRAAKRAPPKPAPTAIKAPAAQDEIALFGLGASFIVQDDALLTTSVRPGSRADRAGLKSGDQVLRMDGAVSSPALVAAKLRDWTPGTRLSLIVRRDLKILSLETERIPAEPRFSRGGRDLSEHEKVTAAERSARAVSDGRAVVNAIAPLTVTVLSDRGLWMRFPKELPPNLKAGDELVAETATGLTVDATLDFLAVPPSSTLRARVLKAVDDGETRTIRLAFYALGLNGGGTYTNLGYATSVTGDQRKTRVSAGGTLVAASPLPDAKRRAPSPVLDADARLRVQLLEPLVINEPPSYWRAGPGLWLKTVEDGGRRYFEITHTISGRSAEAAGLKVGDRLDGIGGRSTEKMDFAEAIDRLYGAPGSEVAVSVLRGKSETLKLRRGLRWSAGKSDPLPFPYSAR